VTPTADAASRRARFASRGARLGSCIRESGRAILNGPARERPQPNFKELTMKLFAKTLRAIAVCLAFVAPAIHAADKDVKAMMMKDHEKMMAMQTTGKPDVDFAMMMREHHLGAVQMAQWQLEHGKDPKMKQMARKIIADQKKEIAQFDQFLASAGRKPAATTQAEGAKGHAGHSK
jgi:hypothetical protein